MKPSSFYDSEFAGFRGFGFRLYGGIPGRSSEALHAANSLYVFIDNSDNPLR